MPWGRSDWDSRGIGQAGKETAGRQLFQKCVCRDEERERGCQKGKWVREGLVLFVYSVLCLAPPRTHLYFFFSEKINEYGLECKNWRFHCESLHPHVPWPPNFLLSGTTTLISYRFLQRYCMNESVNTQVEPFPTNGSTLHALFCPRVFLFPASYLEKLPDQCIASSFLVTAVCSPTTWMSYNLFN